MTMDLNALIDTLSVYAVPVLFAITVHEAAHGYAARFFRGSDRLATRANYPKSLKTH